MHRTHSLMARIAIFILIAVSPFSSIYAQVEAPDSKEVFREDTKDFKRGYKDNAEKVFERKTVEVKDTFFNAPEIEYLKDQKLFKGSGGVIVSHGGVQIQADSGVFDTENKKANVDGNVIVSGGAAEIEAASGKFDLEREVGSFNDASMLFEVDGFRVNTNVLNKVGEDEYKFDKAELTTCNCADKSVPWGIKSNNVDVTKEGYAVARDAKIVCNDIPILYTPYMAFPTKSERASGLLVPQINYSRRDGFIYKQPIFWNYNESTDLIFSPFIETHTRKGLSLDFNKKFSNRNKLESRFYYSDESARDGSLRGTNVSDIFDPEIDESRFGGYYYQTWKSDRSFPIPLQFVADGHYISDDLFLREIEDIDIGKQEDRYLTSRATLSAPLGDYLNAQVRAEYTNSIVEDDDRVFARLPEGTLDGYKSWRVFGFNPYGLKIVTSGSATATRFDRDFGYDGTRYDINPEFKVPFYYKNYLSGDVNLGLTQTYYRLSDATNPDDLSTLDDSSDRSLYEVGFNVSSVLERVYEFSEDSWLRKLAKWGFRNQRNDLLRAKHTIEPFVEYTYVPYEDQESNPLFDALDRVRERSVITYGIDSRFIGRFDYSAESKGELSELQRDEQDVLDDLFDDDQDELTQDVFLDDSFRIRKRKGEKRELAEFTIKQSYDSKLDAPNEREFSDVGTGIGFYPSDYLGFSFGSNFDYEENQFSSWAFATKLSNDRGDHIRARINYVEDSVSQVDTNVEIVLTDRVKIGYYGKYDERENEFIENRAALRLLSKCDCWKLDFGYRDQINPNDHDFLLTLTLKGLGQIG